MAYRSLNIEKFAGLDLRQAPDEGAAIDLLNVDVTNDGVLKTRNGISIHNSAAVAFPILKLVELGTEYSASPWLLRISTTAATTSQLVNISGGSSLTIGGAISLTGASGSNVSNVTIGTPTATYTYFTATGANVARFDPQTGANGTWTNPTFPYAFQVLGHSPTDNRLVIGNVGTDPNMLRFSDPGVPETFGANNYIDLIPGDGETIVDMAVFNNQLYVFKQTKFFVFYGNSSDAAGNPVFNYRTMNFGVGAMGKNHVASSPQGVYFLSSDGVYLTTGGAPKRVSLKLDPFFDGTGNANFLTGNTFFPAGSEAHIAYVQDRLWVTVCTSPDLTYRTFIYNPFSDSWSLWQHPTAGVYVTAVAEHRYSGGVNVTGSRNYTMIGASNNALYRSDPALLTDTLAQTAPAAFTPVQSKYRSAFMDMGSPQSEKTVREVVLDGNGPIDFAWSQEYQEVEASTSVLMQPNANLFKTSIAVAGTAVTSGAPTLSQGASVGDIVIIRVGVNTPARTITAVSDPRGNTWNFGGSLRVVGSSVSVMLAWCYVTTAIQPGDAVTVTLSGSTNLSVAADVFEYGASPTPFDSVSAGATGTGTAISMGSVTTAQTYELIYAVTTLSVFGSITSPPPNFQPVAPALGTSCYTYGYYKYANAVNTYTAPATHSVSTNYAALMIAFKASTDQGRLRDSKRGRLLSYQISSTKPWQLQRLTLNTRKPRPPTVDGP